MRSGFAALRNSCDTDTDRHTHTRTGGSLQFAHLVKSDADRKRLGESWRGGKSLSLANI